MQMCLVQDISIKRRVAGNFPMVHLLWKARVYIFQVDHADIKFYYANIVGQTCIITTVRNM